MQKKYLNPPPNQNWNGTKQKKINQNFSIMKRIIHHDQRNKPGSILNNQLMLIHHINYLKKKSQMIISVNAEKAIDQIQHSFMTKKKKTLRNIGLEENLLNLIKVFMKTQQL